MYNFCTLFDKNYLFKGLALYNSILKFCCDFKLWILCLDDSTFNILEKMSLMNVKLISLGEFEDEELLKIKNTRTRTEYYWTCTPSLPLFILKRQPLIDIITYLDADLFFYSDPLPIYKKFIGYSILITPHNYHNSYQIYQKTCGIYNVQFLIFRNDLNAIKCLNWWRERCIEWCYFKYQDDKLGDQKYLDDWPKIFEGVYDLNLKGAVAPWNVEKYCIRALDGKIFVDDEELIFYHFHQLNIKNPKKFDLSGGYTLSESAIEFIYKPYVYQINEVINFVLKYDSTFRYGYDLSCLPRPTSFKSFIRNIIYKNKWLKNIYRKYFKKN